MKITKDYEGLKRAKNGDYILKGDLITDEDIEIDLDDRLVVRGKIESKKSVRAGWGISAGEFIDCGKRIFASTSVYRGSDDCDKTIQCKELRRGEICYGELVITQEEGESDGEAEKTES